MGVGGGGVEIGVRLGGIRGIFSELLRPALPIPQRRLPRTQRSAAALPPAVGLKMIEELGGFGLRQSDRLGVSLDFGEIGGLATAGWPASAFVFDSAFVSA
jgi:hypothetical protein